MSFRNDFLNTTNSRGIPGRFARRTQLLNADLARASQSSNASSPDSGNAQSMDHSPLPLNNTFEKDATATADIGAAVSPGAGGAGTEIGMGGASSLAAATAVVANGSGIDLVSSRDHFSTDGAAAALSSSSLAYGVEESSLDKELEYIEMIDRTTFDQLLEMDDDDNHEFSKSIVSNYNEQATTTLDQLQEALDKRDLSSVSSLGHFLKGSSAALGLNRMKRACELIQRFGACKSSNGTDPLPDDNVAVDLLTKAMAVVRKVYADSEEYLRHVFD